MPSSGTGCFTLICSRSTRVGKMSATPAGMSVTAGLMRAGHSMIPGTRMPPSRMSPLRPRSSTLVPLASGLAGLTPRAERRHPPRTRFPPIPHPFFAPLFISLKMRRRRRHWRNHIGIAAPVRCVRFIAERWAVLDFHDERAKIRRAPGLQSFVASREKDV